MDKRTKNAVVTLAVGLALNISLGIAKLVVGILSDSVSVSSDALNNLSDAVVSVVTVIAVWASSRAADHEHPFGHGRYEYIATFILGAVIAVVGVEVFISGVERIIEPVDVLFGTAVWITLGCSVAVKAFMAAFYGARYKKNRSDTVKAAMADSMSDAIVTSVVLACAFAESRTSAHIDGYVSLAVAAVILIFAVRILRGTINRLLGSRPDPELVARVENILISSPQVISVHDLVINDYGAAHKIAEADAVFPSDMKFTDVHATCDGLERAVFEETGVRLCLHADPDITDGRLADIRKEVDEVLRAYGATAHDYSVDDATQRVELDVSLADDKSATDEMLSAVKEKVRAVLPYSVDIHVDYI